jgi:glycosyltransferase involved in cell wall biosynthesis
MTKESISVVIISHNDVDNLLRCLQSLREQTLTPIEILVVDNDSSDDTKAVITDLLVSEANIKLIFEKQRSRGAARNTGVRHAIGNIVVMTDADCIFQNTWLEKITFPLIHTGAQAVVGSQYSISNTYTARHMQRMCDFLEKSTVTLDGYTQLIDTKNFAIRKDILFQFMFDSSFVALEDVELSYRIRPYVKIKYLSHVRVGHQHPESIRALAKTAFMRGLWHAKIFRKFKNSNVVDGIYIFPTISTQQFYMQLFTFDYKTLQLQGMSHALFFFTYDLSWKCGSFIGYIRKI